MTASLAAAPVNFHLSLNVANLERSVDFFRTLFGEEPAKHHADYAKFEVKNPPLTLSLEPAPPDGRGALNHAGFRLPDSASLVDLQRRLEMAGIASQREEGVECCYARQTKFWLHDPDGNLWEFYVFEGDIVQRGAGQVPEAVLGQNASIVPASIACPAADHKPRPAEPVRWSHRLGQPMSLPLDAADASLDEVQLQGTFNGSADASRTEAILHEVHRTLSPGGRLSIHCLTADRALDDVPQLPGPAAVVDAVPLVSALLGALEEQGFASVRLTKYGSAPCFQMGGAAMRETMIEAFRPTDCAHAGNHIAVLYMGPLREVTNDRGHAFRRGVATDISPEIWQDLQRSPLADQFVQLVTPANPVACTAE